ncbi:hypothetical protein CEXT_754291 [Caerostris extrusa]|uniref:Uncharacterized protein n=1 Tax=Caerostris extrusa TaxID=172846 RepID=A0AAV4XJ70_CAEEX|nr:hypothetical protein CEXT_754291 [Caerostris extrusa]
MNLDSRTVTFIRSRRRGDIAANPGKCNFLSCVLSKDPFISRGRVFHMIFSKESFPKMSVLLLYASAVVTKLLLNIIPAESCGLMNEFTTVSAAELREFRKFRY